MVQAKGRAHAFWGRNAALTTVLPAFLICSLWNSPTLASPTLLQWKTIQPQQKHFPIPLVLQDNIVFWKHLFLEVDSTSVVFHDQDNLTVIWDILELPTYRDGTVNKRRANALIARHLQDLRYRIYRLEKRKKPRDAFDKKLHRLIRKTSLQHKKAYGTRFPLDGAALRLRAQRGVSDHFLEGLKRAEPWAKQIRSILVEEGVPTELAVMTMVESMFSSTARSYLGAAGVWQLMPCTARHYGVRVSRSRDDRLNIPVATRVAARLLKTNHTSLESWPLAITAYNHGRDALHVAMEKYKTDNLVGLLENYDHRNWGFASQNFYAEFLTVLDICSSPEIECPF